MPVTDLFYYRLDGAPTIYSTNKKNKNKNCKLIYLQLISLNIIFIKIIKKIWATILCLGHGNTLRDNMTCSCININKMCQLRLPSICDKTA